MPVTIYRMKPSPYSSRLCTTLDTTGQPTKVPNLKAVFSELDTAPEHFVKIGRRGEYPFVGGEYTHLLSKTAAFQVRGAYLLLGFDGSDEKWAKHCWLFKPGDAPFTIDNIENPPEPREKHEHEMTAKEWLWKFWGKDKAPLADPTLYV